MKAITVTAYRVAVDALDVIVPLADRRDWPEWGPILNHPWDNAVLVPLPEWQALIEAAVAVVARWDLPAWKDAPATAEYIHALRAALDAVKDSQ